MKRKRKFENFFYWQFCENITTNLKEKNQWNLEIIGGKFVNTKTHGCQ